MKKIYNLIINQDEIRVIDENETLEEIYEFLSDLTYEAENISDSITNIYQILQRLEKNIDNGNLDDNV